MKLYLDSCVTYHTIFVTKFLDKVEELDTTVHGNYNAGVTSSNKKGYHGKFHMWVNKKGMANLLSIPCLETDGYHIKYDTNEDCFVTAPKTWYSEKACHTSK